MVDGGVEHCAKSQAEYCQSHGNTATSVLLCNCLFLGTKCIPTHSRAPKRVGISLPSHRKEISSIVHGPKILLNIFL